MLDTRVEPDHQVATPKMMDHLISLLLKFQARYDGKLVEIVTDLAEARRSGELCLKLHFTHAKSLQELLRKQSMICDVRDNLVHVTINPLFTTIRELEKFVRIVERIVCLNIEISVVKASDLLANPDDKHQLEVLTDFAFSLHNPNIGAAFGAIVKALEGAESESERALLQAKYDEFVALSRELSTDSLQQINKACTPTDPYGGIVVIARNLAHKGQPIVGIASGVRNGYEHPSHEYFSKIFASQCGLAQAMGSSFAPVIEHFEIPKMNAYTNVFMLGILAVDPACMDMNVSTDMVAELHKQLQAGKYDGLFSNVTSRQAQGLLNKLRTQVADEKDVSVQVLQIVGANNFFGIAFNDQGRQTFSDFNKQCRRNLSQAVNIQQGGGSPLHSPRGEHQAGTQEDKSYQVVPK